MSVKRKKTFQRNNEYFHYVYYLQMENNVALYLNKQEFPPFKVD